MFETIKGIIGDIAAGAVKDQRIALSKEQLSTLDFKLRDTSEQLSVALRENAQLSLRITELEKLAEDQKSKIEQLIVSNQKQLTARCSETEEKILLLLINDQCRTASEIASGLGTSFDHAEASLHTLKQRNPKLVNKKFCMVKDLDNPVPDDWCLTPDGQ